MSAHPDEGFLALLVQRGHLELDQARAFLPSLRDGGSLDALLVEHAGWTEDKVRLLRRTRAGEQPLLPGYEVLGRLGVGGTAEVFRARDKRDGGRTVALKILDARLVRDPRALRSFVREAKMLTELSHPGLCRGHGIKKAGETVFAVLEWIEGQTLLELLEERSQPLPESQALEIVLQVAEALAHLGAAGLVHRDVKPGNVMLTPRGEVKLIDLGFCAPAGEQAAADSATGTAEYLAPEQAVGGGAADLRSDVYSLGATLFQLTIGRLPFEPGEDDDVLRQHVMERLSSPELKGRGHSAHLRYFIEKMMAKDADLRYQSWEELLEDMRAQVEGARRADFKGDGGRRGRG